MNSSNFKSGPSALRIVTLVSTLIFSSVAFSEVTLNDRGSWEKSTDSISNVSIIDKTQSLDNDMLGEASLLLAKADSEQPFWRTSFFVNTGQWTSNWFEGPLNEVELEAFEYGAPQDMSKGWVKFDGNPLVSAFASNLASDKTLQLPKAYSGRPNDQALTRGEGKYQGKWLLIFNIDGWAVKGWGMAVADQLSPLKEGKNPFTIAEPFPLTKGTGGQNAPNDWMFKNGVWYAPDESRDHVSKMWTSEDLVNWKLEGAIEGINGHDPGMVWAGDYFYLFNEDDNKITVVRAKDPLGTWEVPPVAVGEDYTPGVAVDVKRHTGDADVLFLNNRWYMFMDDGEHLHYNIAYASTTAENFPYGWQLHNRAFGPQNPDQGQAWDEDTPEGNSFGTGDPDVALEGSTLFMTYERPVGIAYRDLEIENMDGLTATIQIEYMLDGKTGQTKEVPVNSGVNVLTANQLGVPKKATKWRAMLKLSSSDRTRSPVIKYFKVR